MKISHIKDSILTGILLGIGTLLLFSLLLTVGLLLAQQSISSHLRWYGGIFIPLILLLRFYAKQKTHPQTTKTLATILFLTFIAFIFYTIHLY